MRIKGVGAESPPVLERGDLAPESTGKASFKQVLKTAAGQQAAGWDQLLRRVDETAQKLMNEPSMKTLRAYRAAVRDFLKEAVSGSYQMKEESRWDRKGNRRVFCVVQKINQALEDLTTEVLQKNSESINVLAKIDEIRGLLVDLYY